MRGGNGYGTASWLVAEIADADAHIVQNGLRHADSQGERYQRMGDGEQVEGSIASKQLAQNQAAGQRDGNQYGIWDMCAREQ